MPWNNFRLTGYLRIAGILFTMILGSWVFFVKEYYFTSLILLFLLIIQTYDLSRFVERANRRVKRLIDAIENEDFSTRFYEDIQGDSFRDLVNAMNGVMHRFGAIKRQREETLHFLQALMDHAPASMLVLDKSGHIEFQNRAFRQMIGNKNIQELVELEENEAELARAIAALGHDESKSIKLRRASGLENRSLRSTRFAIFGKVLTFVSIQNISSELETREQESWQKLMRVLTHEIMNSVTPLTSLAESAERLMEEDALGNKSDIIRSLQTIQRRGGGLLGFTRAYRSVAQQVQVNWEKVVVHELFKEIAELKRAELEEKGIHLLLDAEQKIVVEADRILLEQVILNLLINALQASKPGTSILLSAQQLADKITIIMQDQGCGISEEDLDKIFVPFFTTKKEGSGIGLSLSRQLLRQMGASLRLESKEGLGTKVIIRF